MSNAVTKDGFEDYEGRKIAREGIDRELNTLDILLRTKVARTAITIEEYIDFRIAQGATLDGIKNELTRDLKEGGRIFGEFRNALKPTFKGSVNRFADTGLNIEIGTEDMRMWVAVLINTCQSPDGDNEDMAFCMSRHGKIKSYTEWEEIGVPKAGATVCGFHCHCVLMPANIAKMDAVYRSN